MPLVRVQYQMMQGAERQILVEFLNGYALCTHASLRRRHDLIGKLAIESALAVLSFAPYHMRVTVVRNPSVTSLEVFKITASSNSPTFGSPLREKAIAPMLGLAPVAGLGTVDASGFSWTFHRHERHCGVMDHREPFDTKATPIENETGTRVKPLLRSEMPREHGLHGIVDGLGRGVAPGSSAG